MKTFLISYINRKYFKTGEIDNIYNIYIIYIYILI